MASTPGSPLYLIGGLTETEWIQPGILDAKAWTVPASRMKTGKEHCVPLCDEAAEIINTMQQWRMADTEPVFLVRGLLSDVSINKTLRTVADGVTVPGFRSSFRDWGAEQASIPRAVMEAALAHSNQDRVEAAYMRSDLFERRRDLMDTWGALLCWCW